MPGTTPQVDVDEVRATTAVLLGVPIDEVDYITQELLEETVSHEPPPSQADSEGGDVGAEVVPNRISYISHVQQSIPMNGRWNILFYEGCRYNQRYILWNDKIDRWVRDGSCRVPNGNYVHRYKLWWRQ